MKFAIALVLFGACTSITGGGGTDPVGSAGSAAPKKGSGFSASLSAELSKDGSATAATIAPGPGSAVPADPKQPDAKPADSKPPDSKPPAVKPQVAEVDPKTGIPVAGSKIDPKTDTNHNSVPEPIVSHGPGPQPPSPKRAHVDPGPSLGAIKLDLEPNWDRDFETAGTISFVLKVPASTDQRVFLFHYGYDLPGAPADRELYKKFLAAQKQLNVTLDRQRGAAWYLEGTDSDSNPAFRMLVTYGGKRLTCSGSLYKDKDSTALGPDLRDKVVNTAKKICETLAL
ncbi:hypothetical protein BH11MYX1_BH11MYX1_18220 [soil metagenome]